jgi:hypothetical protein
MEIRFPCEHECFSDSSVSVGMAKYQGVGDVSRSVSTEYIGNHLVMHQEVGGSVGYWRLPGTNEVIAT